MQEAFIPLSNKNNIQCRWQCLGPTVLAVYAYVVHIYFQLSVSYFVWILYQSDCQELLLRIFLWSKVVYKAHVLYDQAVILSDDAHVILEALKILLVCFKFMLTASEHWRVGFPHRVGEFLVYVKLKHEYFDKLQHPNNILITLNGFIFYIPYQLDNKTLSALYVKNCEFTFQALLQNSLSVNNLLLF